MAQLSAVYALSQYLHTATVVRDQMIGELREVPPVPLRELFIAPKGSNLQAGFVYMRLWYAFLYVVVEGWQELALSDPGVDHAAEAIRTSGDLSTLRRFRNAVFHLQHDPLTAKLTDLHERLNEGILTRLLSLHGALETYFFNWRLREDLSSLDVMPLNALDAAT